MELVYRIEDIHEAAEKVWNTVQGDRVLAFEGEMGAGKTTFIQALCQQIGVKQGMSSPTFSIINEYESPGGAVFHIDLYRCRNEEEAVRAGVEECLYSGNICLVEWPSKAVSLFPDHTRTICIAPVDERTRKISFK